MTGCCPVVVAEWQSTGCTSQVRLPATAGFFTFLSSPQKSNKYSSNFVPKVSCVRMRMRLVDMSQLCESMH